MAALPSSRVVNSSYLRPSVLKTLMRSMVPSAGQFADDDGGSGDTFVSTGESHTISRSGLHRDGRVVDIECGSEPAADFGANGRDADRLGNHRHIQVFH